MADEVMGSSVEGEQLRAKIAAMDAELATVAKERDVANARAAAAAQGKRARVVQEYPRALYQQSVKAEKAYLDRMEALRKEPGQRPKNPLIWYNRKQAKTAAEHASIVAAAKKAKANPWMTGPPPMPTDEGA